MKEYFKKLLSEMDNQTPCVARISIFLSVLLMTGLGIAHFWVSKAFDPQSLGTGFASLFAGGGAIIWGKKDTEKKNDSNS